MTPGNTLTITTARAHCTRAELKVMRSLGGIRMQEEIYSAMYRMVHKYGWNWGLTRGLINRRFGTNYTADELKELYRRHFLTKGE